jgi:hypothetical protein
MALSKIDAANFLDGTLPDTNINNASLDNDNITGLPAGVGGKVLQVVSVAKTDTFSTGTNTFVDVTGLTLNITPSATSSKILVLCDVKLGPDAGVSGVKSRIKQTISSSDTYPYIGDAAGNRTRTSFGNAYVNETGFMAQDASTVLVSPSTTSQITFTYQIAEQAGGTIYVNRNEGDDDNATQGRAASSLTVMEIGA